MVLEHKPIPLMDIISPDILEEFRHENGRITGYARRSQTNCRQSPEDFEAEWFVFAIQKRVLPHKRITELYRQGSTVAVFKPYADGMGFED